MNKRLMQIAVSLAVVVVVPASCLAAPLHGLEKADVKAHNTNIAQEVSELKVDRAPLQQSLKDLNAENKALKADFNAGNLDKAAYKAARAENLAEIQDLRQQIAPLSAEIKSLNALRIQGKDTHDIATTKLTQLIQLLTADIESQLVPRFNLASQTTQITGAFSRPVGVNPTNTLKPMTSLPNGAPRLVRSLGAGNSAIALGANKPTTLAMIASGERVTHQRVTLQVEKNIQVDVAVSANIARDVLNGNMDALARDLYANVVKVDMQATANTVRFLGNSIVFSHS